MRWSKCGVEPQEWNRLAILANELVKLKVDVIVMDNGTAAKIVQATIAPTPICVVGGDLQAAGTVKNLAKPEGNTTGVQVFQPDLVGKRVELLREMVPGLRRVGILLSGRSVPVSVAVLQVAEAACRTLGLELHVSEVSLGEPLDPAFSALIRAGVRRLLVVNHPSLTARRDSVVALAAQNRLPAIYEYGIWAEAGGLMSYGSITADHYRQLAECVDTILRGAKPADVPVQQPRKFEFVVNRKTAKALGLTIPPSLLARADQVIE